MHRACVIGSFVTRSTKLSDRVPDIACSLFIQTVDEFEPTALYKFTKIAGCRDFELLMQKTSGLNTDSWYIEEIEHGGRSFNGKFFPCFEGSGVHKFDNLLADRTADPRNNSKAFCPLALCDLRDRF